MLLGCIADDFTGATDLANKLTCQGLYCVQHNGLPAASGRPAPEADDAVVALALKSGNFGGPDFFARAFEVLP